MAKQETLNGRQKRFVEEYLADENLCATDAAIRAGYSPKTADQQSSRLLTLVKIQQAIHAGMKARAERTGVNQDFVVSKLQQLAESNIKRVAEWDDQRLRIKASSDLSDEDAYMIESIKYTPISVESTGELDAQGRHVRVVEYKAEVKMRKPDQALELLARHLGMLEDGSGDAMPPELEEANRVLDEERAKKETKK